MNNNVILITEICLFTVIYYIEILTSGSKPIFPHYISIILIAFNIAIFAYFIYTSFHITLSFISIMIWFIVIKKINQTINLKKLNKTLKS
jgi:hypothetical protein